MGREEMIMMTQSIQKSSIYAPNRTKPTQKSVVYPQNSSNSGEHLPYQRPNAHSD